LVTGWDPERNKALVNTVQFDTMSNQVKWYKLAHPKTEIPLFYEDFIFPSLQISLNLQLALEITEGYQQP
jgi:hypothetical protein